MMETTEVEKDKLFKSQAYQEAVESKGWGQAAWNWQTRDKESSKRMNNTAQVIAPKKSPLGRYPKMGSDGT
jgi:hypothetical protein